MINNSHTTSTTYSAPQGLRFQINDALKRFIDIVAALLGMLLLAPLYGWIAWRVKRDSPGPVFYHGPRVGRGGKLFKIHKFRTMYEREESYQGPRVTAADDARVTRLGRWLRDTKLNELPQLWNVLVGEMSLVGPRPEDPEIVAGWQDEVRQEVLSVRPGITSPASVTYRYEERLLRKGQVMQSYLGEILPSKLRLDQLYVRHRSLWGDLDTILWTLIVLIPRLKGYTPPEKHLLFGPLARLTRRYLNWFSLDLLITLVSIGTAGLLWRVFAPLDIGWQGAALLAVGFAILYSLVCALAGVYRIDWSHAPAMDAIELLPGVGLATALALLINQIWPPGLLGIPPRVEDGALPAGPLLPQGMIFAASVMALAGFVGIRYRSRLATGLVSRWLRWRRPGYTSSERVLIIGGGETGQFAAWILRNSSVGAPLNIVGFVDDDLYKQGTRIRGVNVIGQRSDIPDLVTKHDIGIILFAIHNIRAEERQELLQICLRTAARVALFPDFPAAMNTFAHNGSTTAMPEDGHTTSQAFSHNAAAVDALPCHLCLTSLSPMKVDSWLAELEQTTRQNGLQDTLEMLQALRQRVRGEALEQFQASFKSERGD